LAALARRLGVPFDAIDDLVQETLLWAWSQRQTLRSEQRFDAWLDAICRNRCRMYLRARFGVGRSRSGIITSLDSMDRPLSGGNDEPLEERDIPDANAVDPLEALSHQDLALLLDRALGELPAPARKVLEVRYVDELSEREGAQALGLSCSAFQARLHRARHQLREVFEGPLRAEAEAFGLPVANTAESAGWQETRIWCNLCGRRRLRGIFAREPDGEMQLRLRCPDCSERYDVDIYGSMGMAGMTGLGGLKAFRPALNRTMHFLVETGINNLSRGVGPCPHCGKLVPIRVLRPEEAIGHISGSPVLCWIMFECPEPGCEKSRPWPCFMHSAVEPLIWFHPVAQRFMREHPRWITTPETVIEYAGQTAIRFRIVDVTSTAQLSVFAEPTTLQVLGTLVE
jgi:RNA polymerase sigma-70 factor (ECF subfamily)